jgi:probable rRNA maturation factor
MPERLLEISNRSEALAPPEADARKLFGALEAAGRFAVPEGELSVAFVDDDEIARVHQAFMGDPAPTDVITFPGDPDMDFAGEIVVSVDHARARAAELDEPFARELSLYLVHGWLHLAGFRDGTDEERTAMRTAEAEALALLETGGGLPDFRLRAHPPEKDAL